MSHLLIQTFSVILENGSSPENGATASLKGYFKLAPPYLRELPSELIQHEKDYRMDELAISTKMMFHLLWITFRFSYYFGWLRALQATSSMPHPRLSKASLTREALGHGK